VSKKQKYKKCLGCGIEKPLSFFYKNKEKKDGYFNKCKCCVKEKDSHKRVSYNRFGGII
tara:strand:+ start:784 stop:960 length:177 start_codon:yes stop_codon:yes gene_type:complete